MKYIDADRLIAEIGRLKEETCIGICEYDKGEENGRMEVLTSLQSTIDSLQQDKAAVELELCTQSWWEERGWIMIPPETTIEGIDSLLKAVRRKLQQEQPKVDLEKEVTRFVSEDKILSRLVKYDDALLIARYFYELGLRRAAEMYDEIEYNRQRAEEESK